MGAGHDITRCIYGRVGGGGGRSLSHLLRFDPTANKHYLCTTESRADRHGSAQDTQAAATLNRDGPWVWIEQGSST